MDWYGKYVGSLLAIAMPTLEALYAFSVLSMFSRVVMIITALRVFVISVLTLKRDWDAAVLATPASIAKTLSSFSIAATVCIALGLGFACSQARAI